MKDTIICAANEDAFNLFFKTHGIWASVLIGEGVRYSEKLKYCAIYRTELSAITNYARIAGIIQIPKGAENAGKSIIFFKPGSQKRFRSKIHRTETDWIQGRRYAYIDELRTVKSLDKLNLDEELLER